ncbi:GNAT family N-acetyltransferase [Actinoplanes sp. NPDC049118]|uniref:GNAT family N-acetyltransferase n=1 Tax=Actinoplanes sp. NPDC049118 TaxID=3155769 RepID=UPI00340B9853
MAGEDAGEDSALSSESEAGRYIRLHEFSEGQPFAPLLQQQVIDLFDRTYSDYPHDAGLTRVDRVRFVAMHNGRVVGHAAFDIRGRYAQIVGLVVDSAFRGRGIGAALERARWARIRGQGLLGYMSCMCEDAWSQTFKSKLGFVPVCVKYGQTYSRVKHQKYSSFLKFSEVEPIPVPILGGAVMVNEYYPALRVISDRQEVIDDAARHDDTYTELLVSPERAVRLLDDPRYFYTGIDLHLHWGTWHHCFQLKNRSFHGGIAAVPYLDPSWVGRRQAMKERLEAQRNRIGAARRTGAPAT